MKSDGFGRLARFRGYGTRFVVGVAVPQANLNAETEIHMLLPDGIAAAVMRMTSPSADSSQRLRDYFETLPSAVVTQFDKMHLDALVVACTGSSYVLGLDVEAELRQRVTEACGAPAIFATDAIAGCLEAAGSDRIGLLAPYPDWLAEVGLEYWRARGFAMRHLSFEGHVEGDTRGIYELDASAAAAMLDRVATEDFDAIVVSGTGLPSLAAAGWPDNGPPVITSNLCLAATAVSLEQGLRGPGAGIVRGLLSDLRESGQIASPDG